MTSSLSLDADAVLWSVAPDGRAAALATRPLLVLMHGYGSHERDLFSLAPFLPRNAVIASLRAPFALDENHAWFPIVDPGLPNRETAARATEAVLDWLDSVRPHTEPSGPPLWALGFSQGGAMATQLMRFAPGRFTALVNLSGFSLDGMVPGDAELETILPPLFWGRDPVDPVIPQFAVERTAAWLPDHTTLTRREYSGIGHSVSREEIDDVTSFLNGTL